MTDKKVAIAVDSLHKNFGPIVAVQDISFTVSYGEVLGFLGPNGAGKSTTMKMIAGFLEPTSGMIKVGDHDIQHDPIEVKKTIGYLPEGAPAYDEMTVCRFLDFIAEVRKIKKSERRQCIDKVVAMMQLESVMNQTIETLSKGYRRRVGLAQCILHDPEVLIMDEPTDGLDPNQKHEVRSLIKGMAKDKAIIISTHILEEVDAVCSRAIIIASGQLLFDGTPAALRSHAEDDSIDQAFRKITTDFYEKHGVSIGS